MALPVTSTSVISLYIHCVFVVGEVLSYDLMDGPNPPRRIMQLKMIKKT